jgi:hypothetical protein
MRQLEMRRRSRRAAAALGGLLLLVAAAAGAQGEAATRMLREAERQLAAGNETGALGEYQAVVSSFPGTSAAAQALLETGRLHLARGRVADVFTVTDKLIAEYARLPEAASGIVLQAEARRREARSLADLEEIETLLRRVANLFPPASFPDLEARSRARTLGAEIDLLQGELSAAAGGLLTAIEAEPASTARTRAHVELAVALLLDPERDESDVIGAIQSLQAAVDAGAAQDGGAADPQAERARDLLTLLHRVWLRPRSGQPIWTSTRTIEGIALRKPRGVAGGPGGMVIASDAASAVVVGADGKALLTQPLRDGARPTAAADGSALLASAGEVFEYPSRRSETFAFLREKLQDLNKVITAARGPFGEWLVLDRGLGAVAVLSREERSLRELPASRAEVVDFAVGPLGRTYVLASREPRILVYGPDYQQVQTITGSWQRPHAIDVDTLGNVVVLDRATRTIELRDRSGATLATVGPTLPGGVALRNPEDIAIDARGRLLVVDEDATGVVVLE